MSSPPIVTATIQSAIIAAVSNIVAQFISAQTNNEPFTLHPLPLLQFTLFALLSTPPNFLWQELLESSFPAYHIAPTNAAILSASRSDDAELDEETRTGTIVEPRLNKANTAIKTLLDQTLGAAVNTLLFSVFMHGFREAVVPGKGLWGVSAMRVGDVNWAAVGERVRREFWGILKAGWTFWPWVSVVNFGFVKSVENRNLLGSLAGLGWGVYMSLFAGGQ